MGGRGEERGIEVLHEEGGGERERAGKKKAKGKGKECKRERRQEEKECQTDSDRRRVSQTDREGMCVVVDRDTNSEKPRTQRKPVHP